MPKSSIWNRELVEKYNIAGPRYTSYPTALQFNDDFGVEDFKKTLKTSNVGKPLSLYLHIPFCENICYYCACNKVITKDKSKADRYLVALVKEAEMIAPYVKGRKVTQIHWGGGTPTFLSNEQIEGLVNKLRELFEFDDDNGEFSIEIDPRSVDNKTMASLAHAGFNRLSMGVQDFNPEVQKAVNRIQPEEDTRHLLLQARRHGFDSINIDLIYGLPHQTVDSFNETIDKIITMAPDRLSVFNYAHLPHRFKPQRRINAYDLPSPQEKLRILESAIKKLTEAGYVYIGMDHFALPHDELTQAQEHGDLHRNFQGYTTHAECDLVGLGVSSISQVGNSYSQSMRGLDEYYERVEAGELAVWRGCYLEDDDLLRREVIMQLICHFKLDFSDIEKAFNINFKEYFADELESLVRFEEDGLLNLTDTGIQVNDAGRLLIRNICMAFDAYFKEVNIIPTYSKAI
ncbi:oxygen-independent coproporphyrinogen III oxidase [Kangiella profundi]|uniref:Coproporphyrinogen-III oxidase n=1 Tax=Kangiella profundi TaxID=1561924 RepID=A0A2K9A9Q5_9GAMM|nr:oxygen-independent coproporphyrinogen III oxidase [Kangiella profundi]AUD78157.1 oxygen-independent coproporphyrinogen III oxidase [Kangiella profundi]GGF05583.1 oxygen-independent coproporphyrinogen III oxidase [Kangiella profundi]